ncbi:hypothetical protein AOLI_G00172380 [Acnodon oligacanthus]
MKLVTEIHHPEYGSAIFMKPQLDVSDIHSSSSDTSGKTITICMSEISITSLYKPSASPFVWANLPSKCRKNLYQKEAAGSSMQMAAQQHGFPEAESTWEKASQICQHTIYKTTRAQILKHRYHLQSLSFSSSAFTAIVKQANMNSRREKLPFALRQDCPVCSADSSLSVSDTGSLCTCIRDYILTDDPVRINNNITLPWNAHSSSSSQDEASTSRFVPQLLDEQDGETQSTSTSSAISSTEGTSTTPSPTSSLTSYEWESDPDCIPGSPPPNEDLRTLDDFLTYAAEQYIQAECAQLQDTNSVSNQLTVMLNSSLANKSSWPSSGPDVSDFAYSNFLPVQEQNEPFKMTFPEEEHEDVLVVDLSFEQRLESELEFLSTHSSGPQWSNSINAVCERPTSLVNPASSPAVSRPLMSEGDVALHVIMEQDYLCESSRTVYYDPSPLCPCINGHMLTDHKVRVNNNTSLPWNAHSSSSSQDEASTSRFVPQLLDEQDGETQSTSTSSAISSTEGTSTTPSPTSSLTSYDWESDPDCIPGSPPPNEDLRTLDDFLTYAAEQYIQAECAQLQDTNSVSNQLTVMLNSSLANKSSWPSSGPDVSGFASSNFLPVQEQNEPFKMTFPEEEHEDVLVVDLSFEQRLESELEFLSTNSSGPQWSNSINAVCERPTTSVNPASSPAVSRPLMSEGDDALHVIMEQDYLWESSRTVYYDPSPRCPCINDHMLTDHKVRINNNTTLPWNAHSSSSSQDEASTSRFAPQLLDEQDGETQSMSTSSAISSTEGTSTTPSPTSSLTSYDWESDPDCIPGSPPPNEDLRTLDDFLTYAAEQYIQAECTQLQDTNSVSNQLTVMLNSSLANKSSWPSSGPDVSGFASSNFLPVQEQNEPFKMTFPEEEHEDVLVVDLSFEQRLESELDSLSTHSSGPQWSNSINAVRERPAASVNPASSPAVSRPLMSEGDVALHVIMEQDYLCESSCTVYYDPSPLCTCINDHMLTDHNNHTELPWNAYSSSSSQDEASISRFAPRLLDEQDGARRPASSPTFSCPPMPDSNVAHQVIMEQDDLCESSRTVYSSISPSNSLASAFDATSISFSMSVSQASLIFKENFLMTFEDKEGKDVPSNQPAFEKETRPNMSSLQEAQQAEGIHGSDVNIQHVPAAPNSLSPQEDHEASNEEALNSTCLPEANRDVGRIATNGFLQESVAAYCEPETAMDMPLSVSFQDEEHAQFPQGASQSHVQFKGQFPGLFNPAGSPIETILSPVYMTNRLHDQGCEEHFRVNFYCQGVDPDIISSYDPLPEASYSMSREALTDYEDEEPCCASLQAAVECSPVWSRSTHLLSHEPSPRYGQDKEIINDLMTLDASQEVCYDTAKVEISGEDKPYVFLDFANNKLLENVYVYEVAKTAACSSSQDEDSPEPSTSVLQLSEQDEIEAVSVKRSLDSSEEENESADSAASCPKRQKISSSHKRRQHKRTRNESDTEAALSSLDADRDGPSRKKRRK